MLQGEISPHDTELILVNSVKNVGATFKDLNDNPIAPAKLSLEILSIDGVTVLYDVYLPSGDRSPNPPRILNPGIGVYEFPFGLDNGLSDNTKTNRTTQMCEYLFRWSATLTAGVQALVTIDPGTGPNSLLKWTSVPNGTPGNFINVEYIHPGTPNQTLQIIRTGSTIQVYLATNALANVTTIANDVLPAVLASTVASEIITVALAPTSLGTDPLAAVSSIPLIGGIDASPEEVIYTDVKIVPTIIFALLNKFRLMIDKTRKLVNSDPNDPCYLGYTDGQLSQYLAGGLQIINSYQPYGTFNFFNFPYFDYDFILLETSLIAGLLSQNLYAVDNDIPQWSDNGSSFLITHGTQLAQYINMLTQRLDKLIPQFKLHFVQSGSIHYQMGANYRLAQLISAAPSGSLFRNLYCKLI